MNNHKTDLEPQNPTFLVGADSRSLFHGTNRRISNLKVDSFLTSEIQDAVFFAELKGGGMVYEFRVNNEDVFRDSGTPQKDWYFSVKKLKPINVWSV